MQENQPSVPQEINVSPTSYKWYVLFLLTVVTTFAHLDKNLIIILQESIKTDLALSDTQLGLLSGLAFALAYTVFGIPVAQLADRFNRKNIISFSLAAWSAITALTGFASNYFQIFLARVGVGIGETGCAPSALSMVADYFPKVERGRAYAIRGMGVYFGLLLGFLIGGLVEEAYGWRMAFWVVGTPGVLFALFFFFSVKEPIRGQLDHRKTDIGTGEVPDIRTVFRFLSTKKTLIYLTLGIIFHVMVGAAFGNWMPPFFARIHNMGTAEIGMWLAFAIGVCGSFGTFLGGYLGDRLSAKDTRWYLWVPMIAFSLSLPFGLGVLLSPTKTMALAFYLMPNILYAFFLGPAYALVQDMVEIKMRATASAIFAILIALLGGGIGPPLAGMISDILEPIYGNDSIRWALCLLIFLELPAIFCFYKASQTIDQDLIV